MCSSKPPTDTCPCPIRMLFPGRWPPALLTPTPLTPCLLGPSLPSLSDAVAQGSPFYLQINPAACHTACPKGGDEGGKCTNPIPAAKYKGTFSNVRVPQVGPTLNGVDMVQGGKVALAAAHVKLVLWPQVWLPWCMRGQGVQASGVRVLRVRASAGHGMGKKGDHVPLARS